MYGYCKCGQQTTPCIPTYYSLYTFYLYIYIYYDCRVGFIALQHTNIVIKFINTVLIGALNVLLKIKKKFFY